MSTGCVVVLHVDFTKWHHDYQRAKEERAPAPPAIDGGSVPSRTDTPVKGGANGDPAPTVTSADTSSAGASNEPAPTVANSDAPPAGASSDTTPAEASGDTVPSHTATETKSVDNDSAAASSQ